MYGWFLVLTVASLAAVAAYAGSDGDGLSDDDEINIYGTDPFNRDTDGDGADDGLEVAEGYDPLDSSDCPPQICERASFALRIAGLIRLLNKPEPLVVSTIEPADGAELEDLPPTITVTLNRDLLGNTVSSSTVMLTASGGDGTFADGNEVTVVPNGITVNASVLTVDLTGVASANDDYRLTLDGSSGSPITDLEGVVLDGDADGNAGGDFLSTFNVTAPPTPAPTLSDIQAAIFTPTCAVIGCHFGGTPQVGMNLEAGNTWSNIVNIGSVQMPSLNRVEPNNPDDSYLVRKIMGTGLFMRMPRGGPPLSQAEIDMIRDWISAGALDN